MHEKLLITPDAHAHLDAIKLWSEASKHLPQGDAENRIQAILKVAFLERFTTCEVQHETSGIAGRVDLRIDEMNANDRGNWTHLVLLELKVLRSFSSTGKSAYSKQDNTSWMEKGVKQTASYQKEFGHREAALCCFDMRTSDEGSACFDPVVDLARTMNIALHRWYLYASSELYRDAQSRRAVESAEAPTTT